MKRIDAITPEGGKYVQSIPEGPDDLPNMTVTETEKLTILVREHAAAGTLVRGTYKGLNEQGQNVYCVQGLALDVLGIARESYSNSFVWMPLVGVNNEGPGGYCGPRLHSPVRPEAVERLCELIPKCAVWSD